MSPFPLRGLYFQSKSVMTSILLYQYPDDSDDLQFHMTSLDFFHNVQKFVAMKLPTICQTYCWKLNEDVFFEHYFIFPLSVKDRHPSTVQARDKCGWVLSFPSISVINLAIKSSIATSNISWHKDGYM